MNTGELAPLYLLAGITVCCVVVLTVMAIVPSLPTLRQALAGVDVDPQLVGLARGILLYFVPVGAGSAIIWVEGWQTPLLVPIAGSVVALIRLLEAMVDRKLKPDQNAINPPPVAGGATGTLAEEALTR